MFIPLIPSSSISICGILIIYDRTHYLLVYEIVVHNPLVRLANAVHICVYFTKLSIYIDMPVLPLSEENSGVDAYSHLDALHVHFTCEQMWFKKIGPIGISGVGVVAAKSDHLRS